MGKGRGRDSEYAKNVHAKTMEEIDKQNKQVKKRTSQPFLRQLCKWLLALTIVMGVGFGILELIWHTHPQYSVSVASSLGSLLAATLLPGVPVLLIAGVQFYRINKGQIKEDSLVYKVCSVIVLGLAGIYALSWIVALIVQAF